MDAKELVLTAARALAVYALMLVVVRALGKRTIGNFSAFDLLVALMIGEVVDEIIYGDVRFLQGTVAIVTIAGLALADGWLAYLSPRLEVFLEGKPTIVMRDGEFDRRGMRKERMTVRDVLSHLRAQGVVDVREVRVAVVENDGSLSVIKHDWAETAQKADVLDRESEERKRSIGREDQDLPSREQRTDSNFALGLEQ